LESTNMLANQQQAQLMAILSEADTKFEDLTLKFASTFTKPEYFRVAWILQHLIIQNVLSIIFHGVLTYLLDAYGFSKTYRSQYPL